MQKTCAQLKDTARDVLLGHYGILIAVTIVTELIAILLQIPFTRMVNVGTTYRAISRIILGYAGMLIVSLITVLINAGMSYIHLQISRNHAVQFSDLLYGFKNRPDRYIGYGLVTIVITCACILPGTLCTLIASFQDPVRMLSLLIIGIALMLVGSIVYIVLMFGFSQTMYLLLDDDNIRVFDAMGASAKYMRGNKWRLFKLHLSFIGWMLLGLLTLGIGYLWIQPYFSQSVVQFYLDVVPSARWQEEP